MQFQYMVKKVKTNYAGYRDKITPLNESSFARFTDSLETLASNAGKYDCLAVCNEWLAYFKDQHLGAGISLEKGPGSDDEKRAFFKDAEKTHWTKEKLEQYLSKHKTDSIEGIWYTRTLIVGVVKDEQRSGNEFIGFMIKADSVNWMPQQVKLRVVKKNNDYLVSYYRSSNHSPVKVTANLRKDTLSFDDYGKFYKGGYPKLNIQTTNQNPSFSVLDQETALLTLPSFFIQHKAAVDSLLNLYKAKLEKTKHLIIDLRKNEGGSVYVFEKLIPYLYTNPILTEKVEVLATADNIRDAYEKEYPYFTDSMKISAKENVRQLKLHLNEYYPLYPAREIVFTEVMPNPARVSVIVNREVASAAELFLLQAKQSKKVKVFGDNSSGTIDYLDVSAIKFPCSIFSLVYPVARSMRLPEHPLDNIGIEPDVKIPAGVVDWVSFVQKYNL